MKKSVVVCLVVLSIAAIAAAQKIGKECQKTFTWTSAASASPSAALAAYVNSTYHQPPAGYNKPGCNHIWGDSAPLSGGIIGAMEAKECKLCDGQVEIRLKSCGSDNPVNDDYTVMINGQTIATGRVWPGPGTPAKTLVIPLPAAKLRAALCGMHRPATIDVFTQDDTIVSSLKVTVKY
jgi:hypothetical protein